MDAEEAEGHDVGAPFGPSTTGAAAGSDSAAVKHHNHVVGSFGGPSEAAPLLGTQVEPWEESMGMAGDSRQAQASALEPVVI